MGPRGNAVIIREETEDLVVAVPPAPTTRVVAETETQINELPEEVQLASEAQTIFDQEMAEQPKSAQDLFNRFANVNRSEKNKSLDRGGINALLQFFGLPCTSEDVRGIIELGDRE